MRRKSQLEKVFVIKDIHGVEWATKAALQNLFGIYAVDFKKYFYTTERRFKNEFVSDYQRIDLSHQTRY